MKKRAPWRSLFYVVGLADIFDARCVFLAISAPRLRLVAELRMHCRFTALMAYDVGLGSLKGGAYA
ncbi:MAG: hypothetical protein NC248_10910 [Bacteroides sp.]|nr:hypothetical protein [Bacteroides sp.]MCM1390981.1 hypothetical protein [Bacteroides sp.]